MDHRPLEERFEDGAPIDYVQLSEDKIEKVWKTSRDRAELTGKANEELW
jgi:hypothetical protein